MLPTRPIVLKGKDAKAFERYQKKAATKNEIAYFTNAEKFYRMHCQKKQSRLPLKRRK